MSQRFGNPEVGCQTGFEDNLDRGRALRSVVKMIPPALIQVYPDEEKNYAIVCQEDCLQGFLVAAAGEILAGNPSPPPGPDGAGWRARCPGVRHSPGSEPSLPA